jgi:hypothetical protein
MSSPQSNDRSALASDSAATGRHSDRSEPERGFDLVVTAAHPHAIEWLDESDWDQLLTPNGLVAVITYGDIAGGRLTDGVSAVAATLRSRGLRMSDHVALLSTRAPRTPDYRDRSNLTSPRPTIPTTSAAPGGRDLPITRTHHDLVLLVPDRRQASLPVEQATPASASRSAHDAIDAHNLGSEGNSSDD